MPGEAMRSRHVPPGRTEEGLSQREPPAWGLGPRAGPGSSLRKLGESSGDWLSEVGAGGLSSAQCPEHTVTSHVPEHERGPPPRLLTTPSPAERKQFPRLPL